MSVLLLLLTNATGSCCAINHCLSLLSPYSKLLTDMNLNITKQDETHEEIGLYHHVNCSSGFTFELTKKREEKCHKIEEQKKRNK